MSGSLPPELHSEEIKQLLRPNIPKSSTTEVEKNPVNVFERWYGFLG